MKAFTSVSNLSFLCKLCATCTALGGVVIEFAQDTQVTQDICQH